MICEKCSGDAARVEPQAPAAMELYRCQKCGHEIWVRTHYVQSALPRAAVYAAVVRAQDTADAKKLRLKVARVFARISGFSLTSLDEQFAQGTLVWDLGLYSDSEKHEIVEASKAVGLNIEFQQQE